MKHFAQVFSLTIPPFLYLSIQIKCLGLSGMRHSPSKVGVLAAGNDNWHM